MTDYVLFCLCFVFFFYHVGITVQEENIDMLRFVDDIAVLADNEEDLQNILSIAYSERNAIWK